jgi:hypothetical protein
MQVDGDLYVVSAFEEHCKRFFATDDPASRAVVSAIESQDPTPSGDAPGFAGALQELLGGRRLEELSPALMERLRRAKNAARESFHRENTLRQTHELERLLRLRAASQRTPLLAPGSGGGGSLSPTSVPSLRRFIAAHSSNVGAHSFISGLGSCLREQIGDRRCAVRRIESLPIA